MFSNCLSASIFAVVALGSTPAWAGDLEDATLDVSGTVSHMLTLDAERAVTTENIALLDARRKLAGMNGGGATAQSTPATVSAAAPTAAQPPAPESEKPVPMALLGIFGLGDNLLADLDIAGARVRFQRGRPFPIGASDYPFRLVAIKVPCVLLSKPDKSEVSVCLANAGL